MGLIDKKVGDFSLGEAFAVGLTKSLSEQILNPVIGNGTILSGAVKLGSAYLVPKMMSNKFTKVLGTALAVDGVEDIVTMIFKGGVAGQSQQSPLI